MTRSGAKAVGLGLALLAGRPAVAADPPRPAPVVVPAGDWLPAGGGVPGDPVWTPARRSPATLPTLGPPASAVVPTGGAVFTPTPTRPQPEPAADKAAPAALPPLPAVPVPAAPPAASVVAPPPAPAVAEPAPIPTPAAAEPTQAPIELKFSPIQAGPGQQPLPPPRPATPSTSPSTSPPAGKSRGGSDDPIGPAAKPPAPKPLPVPAVLPPQPVLEVAPAALMAPHGAVVVPGKHGTFGSMPVDISRDYPRLSELVEGRWWGRRAGADAEVLAGDAPATDRGYVRLEYLLWFMNRFRVPVLATTSTNGGRGILGDPGTQPLFGPGPVGDTLRSGFRVRAGYWFDGCGIDGGFFFLGRDSTTARFDSGQFSTITRPFFSPNSNAEDGELVAFPGIARGDLLIETDSFLYGFDANLRRCICRTCESRSEAFVGFRFLGLNEGLTITESITALAGNPNGLPDGTRLTVRDQFRTRNGFYGGQVGYAREHNWGRFSLDGRASIALGVTHQELDIVGTQVVNRPGVGPEQFTGGLLAAGPNLGTFSKDKFSVVPELTINVGYYVTPRLKAFVGYNFLYWSNVIRPGDQIDRVVDAAFVPNLRPGVPFSGQFRPKPTFTQSDLNVNGIQFGVEYRW